MLISVFLPLSLAVIMLSLGLSLRVADFAVLARRPLAVMMGLLQQVVMVPAVTFAIIWAYGISGELAVGFMILALCPGGVTSNVMAKMAKGDVALSLALTTITSLLSIVIVPVMLAVFFAHFLGADAPEIQIMRTALSMVALTVVPVALGMVLRAVAPGFVARIETGMSRLAVVLFAVVVIVGLLTNWELLSGQIVTLGLVIVTIFVALMGLGYGVPRAIGLEREAARTLSVETGLQNGALGLVVAALITGEAGFSTIAIPAAVYGVTMNAMAVPWILWLVRRTG